MWVKCWITACDTQRPVRFGERGYMPFGLLWECLYRRVLPCSLRFVASLAVPTLNARMSLSGSREVASVHQIIHENKCVLSVLNGHDGGKHCPGQR